MWTITRYSHSCVRIESHGSVLVVDPGMWSEPEAIAGADAVLLTHEHVDHINQQLLAALDVPVFVPDHSTISDPTYSRVQLGSVFMAGGFAIEAVGGEHARVTPGQVPCANLGYIIDSAIYHPGDSLHVPERLIADPPFEVLFSPMQGSWLKTIEVIDFINKVAARLTIGVHDGQMNERGRSVITNWLEHQTAVSFAWLAPGSVVTVEDRAELSIT